MSLMEAAAMGVPSVVTDIRGSRTIVEHEQSGLVVAAHSPREIAEAVIRLLEDRELARRLGDCADSTARARFDAGKSAESVVTEYSRLVSDAIRRPTVPASAHTVTAQTEVKLRAVGD
jgi:glycosyltransferase involved in cell wall biosynthesis